MAIAHSKLTAQGQISGENEVIVRRAGRFSSADIHSALFKNGAVKLRSIEELEEGVRKDMRKNDASR